jgi:asparagine synthase (glutamine-hydrolysing)
LDKLNLSASAEGYWRPERVQVSVTDPEEAGRLFAEKLRECVRIHLRSDVPVGCALSGGLDSSSIAVIVDSLKNGDGGSLHTFTSTFPGDRTDEREYADAIVDEIDAIPHRVTPAPDTFLEDFDRFIWFHDEPVGSLSMYAGYCIARLTRSAGVPVTLNGQGGDEILSGYWQSYFLHLRELLRNGRIWGCGAHFIGALLPRGNPSLIQQLPVMLRRYRARRQPPLEVRLSGTLPKRPSLLTEILSLDSQARRVYEIRTMFLPRLLKWDDRNFMAFSVEGRYPFLDHELIELCLSFSPETLYRQGWTKRPLRFGLRGVIPQKVLHRRSKFGFETPQDRWLCGPLRKALEGWLKGDSPIWSLVDRHEVKKLSEQTWHSNGSQEELGQALFRFFVFDRWLRVCKIQTTTG